MNRQDLSGGFSRRQLIKIAVRSDTADATFGIGILGIDVSFRMDHSFIDILQTVRTYLHQKC